MCVNIMVKSVDFLKTPSKSFFPNDHGAKTGGGGGLTTVSIKDAIHMLYFSLIRGTKISVCYFAGDTI